MASAPDGSAPSGRETSDLSQETIITRSDYPEDPRPAMLNGPGDPENPLDLGLAKGSLMVGPRGLRTELE
ncbi:MAG: hypothetical protein Tsb0024_05510 [Ruegeria sp.]